MERTRTAISRTSFIKGAVAMTAGVGALATLGCAGEARADDAAPVYADGTYTGTGAGMGGDINVTLVIENGHISVADISPNNETQGIGGYEAIDDGTYAQAVEDAQGPDIDNVSGATITTKAIKDAVADALAQASGTATSTPSQDDIIMTHDLYANSKWSFEIPPAPIPEDQITETVTADFIVVGAGTSGLMCAMAATEDGVDVIVIASSDKPVSRGGSNAAFNSRLQKELGREFPLEEARLYFQEQFNSGSWRMDQDKWWDFYNHSGEAMDWLMDKMEAHGI